MKESVSYQGPVKSFNLPPLLHFPFNVMPSLSLHGVFMAGCISQFITTNHAGEDDFCTGGTESSPPLLPPGLLFSHTHSYHLEHW